MDMYDRIQRRPARRQHITPGAAVLGAFGFLVAATCVGMLVYAARYQLLYRRFINDFSASLAASNKMSLRMTWQDKDVPVTTDQASRLCRRITTAGAGTVQKDVPDGDECQLVFGDGASLTRWQVDIPEKNAANPTGTFIRYADADGRIYQYDTAQLLFTEIAAILALP